jgi:hypothetical protein
MDDDKNIIEKAIEAVKDIAHVASEAAKHAMEPDPIKPGDEVIVVPAVSDGIMGAPMMPTVVVIRRKRRAPKKPAVKSAKTPANNAAKKTAKKSAKNKAAKKWKSPSKKAVVKKKTGKKAVKKKKAKKSRR